MGLNEIELGGGESVYCINETQVKKAAEMAAHNTESGPRIERALNEITSTLDKNEQTALAFVLIERLLKT